MLGKNPACTKKSSIFHTHPTQASPNISQNLCSKNLLHQKILTHPTQTQPQNLLGCPGTEVRINGDRISGLLTFTYLIHGDSLGRNNPLILTIDPSTSNEISQGLQPKVKTAQPIHTRDIGFSRLRIARPCWSFGEFTRPMRIFWRIPSEVRGSQLVAGGN